MSPRAASRPALARIGYLDSGSPTSSAQPQAALLQGLRDNDWIEGVNLRVERRYQDGPEERLVPLAAELAKQSVDVIVATSTQAAIATSHVTGTIPIVFAGLQDPVSAGLVRSVARPGGNVTGTALMTPQLHGKRLELLKSVVPGLERVAVMGNPTSAGLNLPEIEAASRPLALEVQLFEAHAVSEFRPVLTTIAASSAQALMVLPDALFSNNRRRLLAEVASMRMPDSYWLRDFAVDGALMAYGGNRADSFRRAAFFVDKILRGASPSDLPVEQPIQFDFTINLQTAQRLGLSIPTPLLTQATELVRNSAT